MLVGLVDYMHCRVGLVVSVALVLTHLGAPAKYTIVSNRTRRPAAFRVRITVVKRSVTLAGLVSQTVTRQEY